MKKKLYILEKKYFSSFLICKEKKKLSTNLFTL